jgi:NAD(P)-dependent dehydrogenase (short-subunit alcohol dehydrogenase family)
MNSLSNKVVIITGAAGGIGTALTKGFLGDGSKVCATDASRFAEASPLRSLDFSGLPLALIITAN